MKIKFTLLWLAILIFSLILSACGFSLTDDITPQPGSQPVSQATSLTAESNQPQPTQSQTHAAPDLPTAASQTPKQFQITGRIINNTSRTISPDTKVTLFTYNQMIKTYVQDARLNGDKFSFEGLTPQTGMIFVANLENDGLTYNSDIVMIEEGMQNLDLPITIYDKTTDPTVLRADRLHIFFEFLDAKTVQIAHLYIISNTSNQVLVPSGPGKPVISFVLPKGSTNIQFQDGSMGERYIQTEGGFADTVSLSPGKGNYRILYSFEMPYQSKLDFSEQLLMPVDAVTIMLPTQLDNQYFKIEGKNIQTSGTRDVEGTPYLTYTAQNLSKNDILQFSIVNDSTAAITNMFKLDSLSGMQIIIGIGVLGLVLAIVGLWFFNRSKKKYPVEEMEEIESEITSMPDESESIMDAIIALDDVYKKGQISEPDYQQRRAALKNRLGDIGKE